MLTNDQMQLIDDARRRVIEGKANIVLHYRINGKAYGEDNYNADRNVMPFACALEDLRKFFQTSGPSWLAVDVEISDLSFAPYVAIKLGACYADMTSEAINYFFRNGVLPVEDTWSSMGQVCPHCGLEKNLDCDVQSIRDHNACVGCHQFMLDTFSSQEDL